MTPEPIYAEPIKTPKTPTVLTTNNDYQPLSIFQQNREKWQKRASTTSADGALLLQQVNQPQSAILTRNRLQPDLVMDLPPPSQQDNTTPPLSSGSTSASSSMTSLDKQVEDAEDDTETLGDHFAKQNQSTLKKNEKFQDSVAIAKKIDKSLSSSSSSESSKSIGKGSMDDVVLRIDESNEGSGDRLSTGSTKSLSALKIEREKSPIPSRNTQKFVSQFADLKLTGGCSTTLKTTPTNPITTQPEKAEKERASFTFGSFKPAISIKPQVLTKKKSIFLQAHSSPSPSTSPGPSDGWTLKKLKIFKSSHDWWISNDVRRWFHNFSHRK